MKKVVGQTNLNQVSDWLQIWSDRSILSERSASRAFDEVTPILKQYLPVQGLILEAGCGPADWVYYLRSIGYDVVGMDFCTPILVDSMGQESSLPLVAGDVFQLPFKDDSLEGILSFGVIEHFEGGPYGALFECYRVLRPGGKLLVSVPHMNLFRRIPFLDPLKKHPRVRQLLNLRTGFWQYKFTTHQLNGFLRATGFSVLEFYPLYHEGGLAFDLPVLKNRRKPWEANWCGKKLAVALMKISPWITNHMILAAAIPKK